MTRRIASVDELAEWMDSARVAGATRFELWHKPRGFEQRKLEGSDPGADTWTVADQMLARVKGSGDSRITYAVLAFGEREPKPLDRVFVTSEEAGLAAMNGAPSSDLTSSGLVLSSAFGMLQQMTAGTFATLQRETEGQRRTNESLVKTSTMSFESFAKGYERTFADLHTRLDAALRDAAELRVRNEALSAAAKEFDAIVAKYTGIITEMEKREHLELDEIEKSKQRRHVAVVQLGLLVPVLMSKMLKSGGPDGPLTPSIISRFLQSLSSEQKKKIAALLQPEQLIALVELMKDAAPSDGDAAAGAAPQASDGGPPVAVANVDLVVTSIVQSVATLPIDAITAVLEACNTRLDSLVQEMAKQETEEAQEAGGAASASPANTNATKPGEPAPPTA